jgi:hypothetical protein
LVCPLSAPTGAGETTSMRALTAMARRSVPRPDRGGSLRKAVDVAVREGVGTRWSAIAHQLAPVKARGGMFAHLCKDLVDSETLRSLADARPVNLGHCRNYATLSPTVPF